MLQLTIAPSAEVGSSEVSARRATGTSTSPGFLEAALEIADRLTSTAARVALAEARLLANVRTSRLYRREGHASFGDFAREWLRLEPSTAWERVKLAALLDDWPVLEARFLKGRLGVSAVLALAPLLDTAAGNPNRELPKPPLARFADGAALSLVDHVESALHAWTRLAERLPVRSLRLLVRWAMEDSATSQVTVLEDDDEDSPRRVAFAAPPVVARLLEECFETARRLLGRQASPGECLEMILIEAAPEDAAAHEERATADGDAPVAARAADRSGQTESTTSPAAANVRSGYVESTTSPAAANVRTRSIQGFHAGLDRIDRDLRRLEARIPATLEESSPDAITRQLFDLQAVVRPLRRLEGRLLAWFQEARQAGMLPIDNFDDFLQSRLRMSPRTQRRLLFENRLFAARNDLEAAWLAGRIGLSQAADLHRRTPRAAAVAWIARAETVTARQLQREILLFERLAACRPDLARRSPGPFPCPELARELGLPAGDPAEEPEYRRRLEEALDRILLQSGDMATLEAAAALESLEDARPMSGHFDRGRVLISIPVRGVVADHWAAAARRIDAEAQRAQPRWMIAAILCFRALRTWRELDPDSRPTEWRVHSRDEYLCQAPGCSSRRNLEAHHIVPRARGGDDSLTNKVTLCHAHHHHVLHAGHLKLKGRAPDRLQWRTWSTDWLGDRRIPRPL